MSMNGFPSRRILVVDDEPLVCDAVRMMLAFDGHQVETAANAKDALVLFGQSKYDLVITDYAMPGMSGDRLALAIKEKVPAQPVVMITAFAEVLPKPLSAVDLIISKPFLLENLRAAIAKVCPAATA
jgi:CheY-like chemotaxis protein